MEQRSKQPVPRRLSLGFASAVLDDISEQPIEPGCDLLLSRIICRTNRRPLLRDFRRVSFPAPSAATGAGGRNLETVLRCAIRLDELKINNGRHFVILSAGTDGIDGNSPAAGAIADETTVQRARKPGLDAPQYLARSDSYGFFERLNTLIITGADWVQMSAICEFFCDRLDCQLRKRI